VPELITPERMTSLLRRIRTSPNPLVFILCLIFTARAESNEYGRVVLGATSLKQLRPLVVNLAAYGLEEALSDILTPPQLERVKSLAHHLLDVAFSDLQVNAMARSIHPILDGVASGARRLCKAANRIGLRDAIGLLAEHLPDDKGAESQ
jgi:hypothetical protein